MGNYHLSYSLNSLKGSYIGDVILQGNTIGVSQGDTRSSDYSLHGLQSIFLK